MKKAFTSLLSMLMAVVVLISGTGFTVKKMVCLHSGKVQAAFYSLDNCCAGKNDQKDEAQIKSGCCKYSSESFYLDHNATVKTFTIKNADAADAVPAVIKTFTLLPTGKTTPVHSFADLPPPLSGRERLTLISTFLI